MENNIVSFCDINDDLLAISQSSTIVNSLLTRSKSAGRLLLVADILVSSANLIASKFLRQLLKSLTYTKNNNGPKIEPCGTP